MDKRKWHYLLHSGKNSNLKYYLRSYLRELTPKVLSQWRLAHDLKTIDRRPDREHILQRADYFH